MTSPTDPSEKLVAVVGATGRQGSAVTRHLLRDGWRVRALTRNPASPAALRLRDLGAELRQVDAMDVTSLGPALRGAQSLFTVQNPMTSSIDTEVQQGRNVADAAAAEGIQHVVYGAAGVGDEPTGVPSWDSKIAVANHFRQQGLTLTVLRPMAFMELMTDRAYYPSLGVWGLMPKLMGSSRPVGWLCTDDLGAIAARVFADPERWAGRSLGLASDVQSIDECRVIWRAVTGLSPRGVALPVPLFERFTGKDLTTMWRWLRTHSFDLSPDTARSLLPEALSVRTWLTRVRGQRR